MSSDHCWYGLHDQRREVGEDGDAVEDVLGLGEVDPVHAVECRRHRGAPDADADKVDGLVLEARVVGGAVVAVGELGERWVVGRHAEQRRQGHRRE